MNHEIVYMVGDSIESILPTRICLVDIDLPADNKLHVTFPDHEMTGPALCSRNAKVDSRLRFSSEQDGHLQVGCL